MLTNLSKLFQPSRDSDYVHLMQTEFRHEYERARREGQPLTQKYVRNFLRGQGFTL